MRLLCLLLLLPLLASADTNELMLQMQELKIPRVQYSNEPLSSVLLDLNALVKEQAPESDIEIHFMEKWDGPPVSITLRNFTLDKVLDYITKSVSYQYRVNDGIILVYANPFASQYELTLVRYPIPTKGLLGLLGSEQKVFDDERDLPRVQAQLQGKGVQFDPIPGARLEYDGRYLYVYQSPLNHEKLTDLLDPWVKKDGKAAARDEDAVPVIRVPYPKID